MQYMLMFWEDPADAARRDGPEAPAYWGGWTAYVQAIASAGIMVSGNGLQLPHTATSLRLREGRRLVQDGPYADTKEQLGGYFIIEVPTLDAALDWAARAPNAARGGVEVRPVMPPPPNG
ncbi:MAG TPA: YciI family protein [Nevskiaceae bacterium]|nr:YciI family protein [Nevskiaceae bacterium]